MTKSTRAVLTILAALVAGLTAVSDRLPSTVQLLVVVASTTLAALGILPPGAIRETGETGETDR